MNADRLLALFERISEAPDAIPRLRRFILDLAVRGKLVEQDPEDEPAEVLLGRISYEKVRMSRAGEIRKPKQLPEIDEAPFMVPSNWTWCRIREATSDRAQKVPIERFTYIDVSAINKEAGTISEPVILNPSDAPSRARKIVKKGDVVYSCVRPYLLNIAIVDFDFDPEPIVSTAFAVLYGHELVLPRYLWIVLRSPFIVKCVEECQRGQAYPAINDADFSLLPFPLPPLAEQHRIVAKVDELMALCDQLEAARQEGEQCRERLMAASLQRLNQPSDDFYSDARFALQVLPSLTSTPAQIKQLRQTILNLAVRGKLVEQDPGDEPAVELLAHFAQAKLERKRITGDARIKNEDDPLPDIMPMSMPESWACQSFQNLFLFIDYRGNTPPKTSEGVPLITAKNIRMGYLDREPREHVSPETFDAWMTRGFPRLGDLFFTMEAPLGNVCVNTIEEPFALAQRVVCLQPYAEIETRFVMYSLMSDSMQEMIGGQATGLTAKGIKAAKLKPLPIPLPPLAEQHRIVAKVDELMALCDQLEQQLSQAEQSRRGLLETVLLEALADSQADLALEGRA